jgi:Tat protein secretion system quality control protein TatD with DNase activity
VTLTAMRVAELRSADPDALAEAMTANAARLFRVAVD